MTEQTPLDQAHAAMEAAPEHDRARLAFFERLAGSELFLLLDGAPEGEAVMPQAFTVDGRNYVLVFDLEERLAGFAGGEAAYAALSGRALVEMLKPEALGLALNPDQAPSAMLLPPEGVAWLADMLGEGPQEVQAAPRELQAPKGLPEELLTALDARLASAGGLAPAAYLAGVTYESNATGHLLAFVDAAPGAEAALAQAVSEVVTFSGLEAAALDVGFFRASDAIAARLALVGLRFDLPGPEARKVPGAEPGMDPKKPPKLR